MNIWYHGMTFKGFFVVFFAEIDAAMARYNNVMKREAGGLVVTFLACRAKPPGHKLPGFQFSLKKKAGHP